MQQLSWFIQNMAIASASGCIMYLIWDYASRRTGMEKRVGMLYHALKALIAVYFFPFILFMPRVRRRSAWVYMRTGWTMKVCMILLAVWMIGAAAVGCHYLFHFARHRRAYSGLIECGVHVQELAQRTAAQMGIRRKIRVKEGAAVIMPELSGWLHPTIRLPLGAYEDEKLVYIFTHELTHVKNGDVPIRGLMLLTACVFWMSPVCRRLARKLDTWSEYYCDEKVCSYPFIKRKRYAEILYEMMEKSEKKRSFLTPGLYEGGFELERRIHLMEKNRGKKRMGAAAAAGIALVFLSVQSVSAWAVGEGVDRLYGKAVRKTMVIIMEEPQEAEDGLEESIIALDEEMLAEIRESADAARMRSAVNNVNVTLTNDVYYSEGFEAEVGGEVYIGVSMDPANVKIKAGIVQPDGTYKNVEGSKRIYHSFAITQSGTHQVVIWNETDNEVTVRGVIEIN